jgi:hypothetical protein
MAPMVVGPRPPAITSRVIDRTPVRRNHRATFNERSHEMSMFDSPRFLRNVLLADSASCLATGALQVALTQPLAQLTNLPAGLLMATGVFLLAYAALVGIVALRDPVPRALVWVFVAGNFAWAAGCAALIVEHAVAPTLLGEAWLIAQAVTVVVLAELQWMGLRRQAPLGWA